MNFFYQTFSHLFQDIIVQRSTLFASFSFTLHYVSDLLHSSKGIRNLYSLPIGDRHAHPMSLGGTVGKRRIFILRFSRPNLVFCTRLLNIENRRCLTQYQDITNKSSAFRISSYIRKYVLKICRMDSVSRIKTTMSYHLFGSLEIFSKMNSVFKML